jgi:hypothetical protein
MRSFLITTTLVAMHANILINQTYPQLIEYPQALCDQISCCQSHLAIREWVHHTDCSKPILRDNVICNEDNNPCNSVQSVNPPVPESPDYSHGPHLQPQSCQRFVSELHPDTQW